MAITQPAVTRTYTLDDVTPLPKFLLDYLFKPFLVVAALGTALFTIAFAALGQPFQQMAAAAQPALPSSTGGGVAGPALAPPGQSCSTFSGCATNPSCPAGYDLQMISDPSNPGTACNMCNGQPSTCMWDYRCVPNPSCGGGGNTGGGGPGCGNGVCDPTDLNDGCGWECAPPPPTPIPTANLGISKTPSSTVVGTGGTFTYTITVGNSGPQAAGNVVVTDTLPAGLTFVSSTPAPSNVAGQTLTWNMGTVAVGSRVITVTVQADANGTYSNGAAVASTTQDPVPSNNSTTAPDVTATTPADISVSKTTTAGIVLTGSTFDYTLTVANAGPADAENAVVTDTLPAGLTFISASPAPTNVAGQTLTWDLGTFAPGTATITVTVQGDTPGTVTNGVAITSDTPDILPGDNNDTAPDVIVADPAGVSIQKTASTTSATVGSTFSYTLAVINIGPGAALGVSVEDTLPDQLTFVSSTPAPSNVAGQSLTWDLGTLAPGLTTIVVTVEATLPGTASNGVTVTAGNDPDGSDNQDDGPDVSIVYPPGVGIYKMASATTAMTGQTFTYSLVAANGGPGAATGVTVSDSLPGELAFVSSTPAPSSQSGQDFTWNLGNLVANSSRTITVTVRAMTPGTATNTGTVSSTSPDPDTGDNTSTAPPVTVAYPAGLSIAKVADVSNASVGQTFGYTINVNNGGPGDANSVVVSDTLPSQITFQSSSPAPTTITPGTNGQTLTWDLGTVSPGTTQILLSVQAASPGTASNGVTISAANDPDTSDNSDSAPPVTIGGGSGGGGDNSVPLIIGDPAISKWGSPEHATIGETVTWHIRIANPSQETSDSGSFVDNMPAAFDIVNIVIDGPGTYSISGQAITFDIPALPAGAQVNITITTTVNGNGQPGSVCNSFQRSGGASAPTVGCMTLVPSSLPKTGFGGLPWPIIGGIALAVLAGLFVLFRRA